MEIEKIGGYTPEACRAAKILHNSYSLYKRMEKLYMTCVVEAVEIDRHVFNMEDLGRGLGTIILTQEGDLEKMGEEELASAIKAGIDERFCKSLPFYLSKC